MLKQLVSDSRSVRRFDQERRIEPQSLRDLAELARLSPSHRNAQQLRLILLDQPQQCAAVFPHLSFAAALGEAGRPPAGQRPAAYIILTSKAELSNFLWCDAGAACQSMLLGACELGLRGCIHGGVRREELRQSLGLSTETHILFVLSLGWPAEQVVIEPQRGDINAYWRDNNVHHVPKLGLDEIIITEHLLK